MCYSKVETGHNLTPPPHPQHLSLKSLTRIYCRINDANMLLSTYDCVVLNKFMLVFSVEYWSGMNTRLHLILLCPAVRCYEFKLDWHGVKAVVTVQCQNVQTESSAPLTFYTAIMHNAWQVTVLVIVLVWGVMLTKKKKKNIFNTVQKTQKLKS